MRGRGGRSVGVAPDVKVPMVSQKLISPPTYSVDTERVCAKKTGLAGCIYINQLCLCSSLVASERDTYKWTGDTCHLSCWARFQKGHILLDGGHGYHGDTLTTDTLRRGHAWTVDAER